MHILLRALLCSLLIWLQTTHKCRSRTYYLAAETEAEMNKWVMTLCKVLGLAETGMFTLVLLWLQNFCWWSVLAGFGGKLWFRFQFFM